MSGLQFPKPSFRFNAKKHRREEQLAYWAGVCRFVDRRDQGRCRACGKRCDVKAIGLLDRAHRHHVVYRSAGGPDETWNIATLCAGCHAAQHEGLIDVRGNADEGLEVWSRDEDGWYLSRREVAVHCVEKD